MSKTNDFFHMDDYHNREFLSWKLPEGWWSRHYEYDWAYSFLKDGDVSADLGTGFTFRPFRHALAIASKTVYAVDVHVPEDVDKFAPNMHYVSGSFLGVLPIDSDSVNRVFCLSVLEDVVGPLGIEKALTEMKRIVAPGGQIILTFDVPHDNDKPQHELYKGVDLSKFIAAVNKAGLKTDQPFYKSPMNLRLYNSEFNLCVYHCVLGK